MTAGLDAAGVPPIADLRADARRWLAEHAEPTYVAELVWGQGSDSVALFQNLSATDERAFIDARRDWIRAKADAGWANVTWSPEWGGRGWPRSHEEAFAEEEATFTVPPGHDLLTITVELIAPTIRAVGSAAQQARWLRPMLRTDELWCQLFSEPGAGSDLAGVSTRAEHDGGEWVLDGQKVWTSGAQYADWGYVLCRTDPDAPKHRGLTAFAVDLSTAGVEVRPLRQMSGGSCFNEVFFDGARVPDEHRLGAVDGGWAVAITTLGFERGSFSPDGFDRKVRLLRALARQAGRAGDPIVRQLLARAYTDQRVLELTTARGGSRRRAGEVPGPEGSIGKLALTECLRRLNEVAAELLGPRLVADDGTWGSFAWAEHVLGTAGYRVAGGTDEVQRNIIGERVLGLPGEPRIDRDLPFRVVPR